jgi:hypothetical protein
VENLKNANANGVIKLNTKCIWYVLFLPHDGDLCFHEDLYTEKKTVSIIVFKSHKASLQVTKNIDITVHDENFVNYHNNHV